MPICSYTESKANTKRHQERKGHNQVKERYVKSDMRTKATRILANKFNNYHYEFHSRLFDSETTTPPPTCLTKLNKQNWFFVSLCSFSFCWKIAIVSSVLPVLILADLSLSGFLMFCLSLSLCFRPERLKFFRAFK